MKTKYFLIGGLFLLSPFFASANIDHLVISQVQITGGEHKTSNDFIELYNPTAQDLTLAGHKLVKRTKTGTADSSLVAWTSSDASIIKANGYYLWANADYLDIPVTPDIVRKSTIAEDNSIALLNKSGEVIDSLGWGQAANIYVEGTAAVFDGSKVQSLERKPGGSNGNGQDTGNNREDFFIQSPPHPRNSAGQEGIVLVESGKTADQESATPAPRQYTSALLISEFLPNPEGADTGEEWVELYNPSNEIVELSGWKLDDKALEGDQAGVTSYSFPDSVKIMPGEYLIANLSEENFGLGNFGGDELRLIAPDGSVAAKVIYDIDAPEEQSYARRPDGSYAWTFKATKNRANEFDDNKPLDAKVLGVALPNGDELVRITEVVPNPPGKDAGNEQVTLANTGQIKVDLAGWILDDGNAADKIGSSAYTLGSLALEPNASQRFVIPPGKFALNNTGPEHLRLFNGQKILIDQVDFNNAKEGETLAVSAGTLKWFTPQETPNQPSALAAGQTLADTELSANAEAEEGEVAGARKGPLLPRTGLDLVLCIRLFVIFGLVWYIFRVSLRKEASPIPGN